MPNRIRNSRPRPGAKVGAPRQRAFATAAAAFLSRSAELIEAPIKLLIVDDDDVSREHVRRQVRRTGLSIEVHEAANMAEGSQRLKSGKIDCALVDYNLGDGSAFDMMNDLHAENPGFRVPVILFTGEGNEEVAVKALKLGISDYLSKDRMNPQVLEQVVRAAIAEHKFIAAEARHREELEHLSMHDDLTGMPNRRVFLDRLEQRVLSAQRSGEAFALLSLDLDMFKPINDMFGHDAGDFVLRTVGERLLRLARRSDTYARFGGDEFVALLASSSGVEGAISVAQRIIELVMQPVALPSRIVEVGVSVGIAVYPEHGTTSQSLLAHADEAMYVAKRSKHHLAVYGGMDRSPVHENAKIAVEISALAKAEHVELLYQPKYRLDDGRMVGVEALARWRHPELGYVAPARFIPIIERSKFLAEFTSVVLNKALDQVAIWRTEGLSLPVAVNVSALALSEPDFTAQVIETLGRCGLQGSDLIIEVTESVSLYNFDQSAQILRNLADVGIGISIDDFGTGYTSIRYLREFPATELKIDRLFVTGLHKASPDYSIVAGIVRLAEGIGANTVGEGIESEEVLRLLAELGCDYGQGYFLARPQSAEAISGTAGQARTSTQGCAPYGSDVNGTDASVD